MSLTNEERYEVVTYRLEKAQKTIGQVESIIPLQYWEIVANRLYYAAYYAVSALLIARGHTVRTHEGIIQCFGNNFVKTGIVSKEQGKLYSQLFTLRLKGDYEDKYDLTKEAVLHLVEPTKFFIDSISKMAIQTISPATQDIK